jgi:hypothetical protein
LIRPCIKDDEELWRHLDNKPYGGTHAAGFRRQTVLVADVVNKQEFQNKIIKGLGFRPEDGNSQ